MLRARSAPLSFRPQLALSCHDYKTTSSRRPLFRNFASNPPGFPKFLGRPPKMFRGGMGQELDTQVNQVMQQLKDQGEWANSLRAWLASFRIGLHLLFKDIPGAKEYMKQYANDGLPETRNTYFLRMIMANSYEEVQSIVEELKKSEFGMTAEAYESLIAFAPDMQTAERHFREMLVNGFPLSKETFELMFVTCLENGEQRKALDYAAEMIRRGIAPDEDTLDIIDPTNKLPLEKMKLKEMWTLMGDSGFDLSEHMGFVMAGVLDMCMTMEDETAPEKKRAKARFLLELARTENDVTLEDIVFEWYDRSYHGKYIKFWKEMMKKRPGSRLKPRHLERMNAVLNATAEKSTSRHEHNKQEKAIEEEKEDKKKEEKLEEEEEQSTTFAEKGSDVPKPGRMKKKKQSKS